MASERGIEVIESRSTRARNYTNLVSVKLHTSEGERWVEGAVFERTSPRLVLLDGIGRAAISADYPREALESLLLERAGA